jgi:hypothetical protein
VILICVGGTPVPAQGSLKGQDYAKNERVNPATVAAIRLQGNGK